MIKTKPMLVFSEGACQARAVLLDVPPGSLGALLAGRPCALKGSFALGHWPVPEGTGIPGSRSSSPGAWPGERPESRKPAPPWPPAPRPPPARMALPPRPPRGRVEDYSLEPGPVARVNSSPDPRPAPGWRLRPTPGRPPPPRGEPQPPAPRAGVGRTRCRRRSRSGLAGGGGGGGGAEGGSRAAWPQRRAGRAGSESRKPPRPPGGPVHRWIWRGDGENVGLGSGGACGARGSPRGTRRENPPGGAAARSPREGPAAQGWPPRAVWWSWGPCYSKGIVRFSF